MLVLANLVVSSKLDVSNSKIAYLSDRFHTRKKAEDRHRKNEEVDSGDSNSTLSSRSE